MMLARYAASCAQVEETAVAVVEHEGRPESTAVGATSHPANVVRAASVAAGALGKLATTSKILRRREGA